MEILSKAHAESTGSSLVEDSERNNGKLLKVVIKYDSEYAAKSVTGEYNGPKNKKLIQNIRKILHGLEEESESTQQGVRLELSFEHVKGHSGDPWNDLADECAGRGSEGCAKYVDFDAPLYSL